MNFCTKCGTLLSENAKFCSSCGKQVSLSHSGAKIVETSAAPMQETKAASEEVIVQYPCMIGRAGNMKVAGEGVLTLTNKRIIWDIDREASKRTLAKGGLGLGVIALAVAGSAVKNSETHIELPLKSIVSYLEPKIILNVGAALNFTDFRGDRYNFILRNNKKAKGQAMAGECLGIVRQITGL